MADKKVDVGSLLEKAKQEPVFRRTRRSEADEYIDVIVELKEQRGFGYNQVQEWMEKNGVKLTLNSIVRSFRTLRPDLIIKRTRRNVLGKPENVLGKPVDKSVEKPQKAKRAA